MSIQLTSGLIVPSSTDVISTSDLTSAIPSTAVSLVPSSSATSESPESSTTSAQPTTTSSSQETTSTPHTTSHTTSTDQSTTSESDTPTSSSSSSSSSPSPSPSSSSSPTTSSAPTPSPSSSSTTTQPPTSSSSQRQGTPTTITSAFTTFVNGSAILTQTAIPSTIPQLSGPSSGTRTAIIAGSAAGGTALLILLLSLAFCARRKQFKRLDFLRAITLKRKQERSRATFLDGEDLDDIDLSRTPRLYADYDMPWDGTGRPLVGRTGPDWRWSETETGSAFREDLSPPHVHEGTRLMDPLANRDDPDLSRIVDDVMGPSSSAVHFSDRSVSSMYRGSVVESEGLVHSRTVSDASNTALLETAGLSAPGLLSTAPVRSSPLAQPGTKPGPGSADHQSGEAS